MAHKQECPDESVWRSARPASIRERMDSLVPRRFRRGVFRGYVEELKHQGTFDAVRAGASPALVAALDDPLGLPSWIDHSLIEEALKGVFRLGGRNAVRDLGHSVMQRRFGTVLEPIVHVALRLFHGGPAALYARANLMLAVSTQGIAMEWVASGPTSGTMHIRCGEPMPELGCISWEGALACGLELANARGLVAEGRRSADGKSCEVDVSWERSR
jgi:hypothetical protein